MMMKRVRRCAICPTHQVPRSAKVAFNHRYSVDEHWIQEDTEHIVYTHTHAHLHTHSSQAPYAHERYAKTLACFERRSLQLGFWRGHRTYAAHGPVAFSRIRSVFYALVIEGASFF